MSPTVLTCPSWDAHYANELEQNAFNDYSVDLNPENLYSWFDDVGAPAKILDFLTSEGFPLSPNYTSNGLNPSTADSSTVRNNRLNLPSVLDLGAGNGSTLFQLRLDGGYRGPLIGVDYSPQSIDLARKVSEGYSDERNDELRDIRFEAMDIIHDKPEDQAWWPVYQGEEVGFDLVLDKGTFDAISLSSETIPSTDGTERRLCEVYPAKVVRMVKPGGYLLVTSCNWTEDEVVRWFRGDGHARYEQVDVWGTVKYPTYKFGGQEGQGVATVCFRRSR